MGKTLVTNTTEGAIRVGTVVVAAGKSEKVDSDLLEILRDEEASPAAQAHGKSLVDGTPEIDGKPLVDGKLIEDGTAEAKKIVADAKTEAKKIVADAKTEAKKIVADAKKPATPPAPPAGK